LPLFSTRLSASVKMRESHQQSKPLIHMAASHKLTQQFVDLLKEINSKKTKLAKSRLKNA